MPSSPSAQDLDLDVIGTLDDAALDVLAQLLVDLDAADLDSQPAPTEPTAGIGDNTTGTDT